MTTASRGSSARAEGAGSATTAARSTAIGSHGKGVGRSGRRVRFFMVFPPFTRIRRKKSAAIAQVNRKNRNSSSIHSRFPLKSGAELVV
jgi:hypothetical protein